jgi:hypothetical protein
MSKQEPWIYGSSICFNDDLHKTKMNQSISSFYNEVHPVTEPEILTKGGTLYITFSALYIYIGADL